MNHFYFFISLLSICFNLTAVLPSEHDDVVLVTVSDDRSGRKEGKYSLTQDKIETLFKNNPQFGIKRFRMWKWAKIVKTSYYKENKSLFDNPQPDMNGRAYKPIAIYESLKELKNGEFLIYTDSSPEMWSAFTEKSDLSPKIYDLNVIKNLCRQNNNILTVHVKWDFGSGFVKQGEPGKHTHANFTLDRCIKKMNLWQYREGLQHASGMWVICKNDETLRFVEEWLYWNLIPDCASLGHPEILNDYTFWVEEKNKKIGHRHDQSISGLLINRMGNNLIEIPLDMLGFHPYNFLQFTRKNVNYTFINSNITIK